MTDFNWTRVLAFLVVVGSVSAGVTFGADIIKELFGKWAAAGALVALIIFLLYREGRKPSVNCSEGKDDE